MKPRVVESVAVILETCYPAGMKQFSIKNDAAVDTLERIVAATGKGKTAIVLEALEQYEQALLPGLDVEAVIEIMRRDVHANVKPEFIGRPPTKEEIEDELGMP